MKLFQTLLLLFLLISCGKPQKEVIQEISRIGDKLSAPISSESPVFEELLAICSALRSKERWFSGVYGPSEGFQFSFSHTDCDESKNVKKQNVHAFLKAKASPIFFQTTQEFFLKELQTSSDWPHNVLGRFCPDSLGNSISTNIYQDLNYIYEFQIQSGIGKYSTVFINKADISKKIIQTNEIMVRLEGNKREYGLVYYHKQIKLCNDGTKVSSTTQKLIELPKK
ncbi:MAG: hypothetical protein H6622_13875 [Halobacteriovoraceae bacterium]|nr:hypothetical protein [Halobacteriovoraceae bacterium]